MSDFEIIEGSMNDSSDYEIIETNDFEVNPELDNSETTLNFNGENSLINRLMSDFSVTEGGLSNLLETYFPQYYSSELSLTGNLLQIREYLQQKQANGDSLTAIEKMLLNAANRANREIEKTKKEEITKTLKGSLPYIILGLLFFVWISQRKK